MLLKDKTAVVFGGGGDVGSAVARAFAAAGARVFLAGRTLATLDATAAAIRAAGGAAEVGIADALDRESVDRFVDEVAGRTGGLDITFNAIYFGDTHGQSVIEMPMQRFLGPVHNAIASHMLIARAATRHMAGKGGVIMAITANAARMAIPNLGGFGVACAAVEGFCRQLAADIGPLGIRVVCVRSSGSPDTRGVGEAFDLHARLAGITRAEFDARTTRDVPLRRLPAVAEVANAAVLMASDRASAMTAVVANVTCGAMPD